MAMQQVSDKKALNLLNMWRLFKWNLKQNHILHISTKELTNKDLRSEEYNIIENNHPKEEAWNLLVPKLIRTISIIKNCV